MIDKTWDWIIKNSLWIASIGLMLASSGLDGAFLCKLMPESLWWLGLVLNTTTDVTSEFISYWTGRLAQDASKTKRRLSKLLWLPQGLLVGYAWLFSWRQIIPIMRIIEPQDYKWLSPICAGFVSVALVAVGYTQSLLAGKIEKEEVAVQNTAITANGDAVGAAAQSLIATYADWRGIADKLNGDRAKLTAERVNTLLIEAGYAAKPESTARYWAKKTRE